MTTSGDDTVQPGAVEAIPSPPRLSGRRLAIRADGATGIGVGHVMRCLAIAARWVQAGGSARLACSAVPDSVADRYGAAGVAVERRSVWLPVDLLAGVDAVVVDLPTIKGDDLAAIAGGHAVLVTVDDMADRPSYPGDIVLNQNAHASAALYRGKTAARLCAGPSWCLLRPGFAERRAAGRTVADRVSRILVVLGGADPRGYSAAVVTAVAEAASTVAPAPEIVLVVGAANPALSPLQDLAGRLPVPTRVLHDVHDMPALIAASDMAVSAAGSTVWELATLGTPMILGSQNASEIGPATALEAQGAALYLGPFELLRPEALTAAVKALLGDGGRRRRMSNAGRDLVDGRGVDRLLALVSERMAGRQPRN